MSGRYPKPVSLKLIEGNPGKRPLKSSEPKPAPVRPLCPKWLTEVAKGEWRRLAPELERLGLLTRIDRGLFAQYCQAYSRFRFAEEMIAKHGPILKTKSGFVVQSPFISISNKAQMVMLRTSQELGLSPASRGRISIKPTEEDDWGGILD